MRVKGAFEKNVLFRTFMYLHWMSLYMYCKDREIFFSIFDWATPEIYSKLYKND